MFKLSKGLKAELLDTGKIRISRLCKPIKVDPEELHLQNINQTEDITVFDFDQTQNIRLEYSDGVECNYTPNGRQAYVHVKKVKNNLTDYVIIKFDDGLGYCDRRVEITGVEIQLSTDEIELKNDPVYIDILNANELQKLRVVNPFDDAFATLEGNKIKVIPLKVGTGEKHTFQLQTNNAGSKIVYYTNNSTEVAKIDIEVNKTDYRLRRGEDWTDSIQITNYKNLVNLRIKTDIDPKGGIQVSLNTNTGTANISLIDSYKYNWDMINAATYGNLNSFTLTADNATKEIKIGISFESRKDCESRIGVASINYKFGVLRFNGAIEACGGIDVRSTGNSYSINQSLGKGKVKMTGGNDKPRIMADGIQSPGEGTCNVYVRTPEVMWTTPTITLGETVPLSGSSCSVDYAEF